MEMHLEGILETLLVGAIAGMLVLSILFFFMGHVLRIEVVERFFQFLIYEDEETANSKNPAVRRPVEDPIDVPLSPPTRAAAPAHRPVPSHFVLVVLTALLYGAGVVVESRSHTDQDGHDALMKLAAFDSVVHGWLASGADPEPGLARFVADYDACHMTHTNTEAVGSRDVRKLAVQRARGNDLSPCKQIDVRVAEFYHNAKNRVFQEDKYNEELINLQSRINFVRSIYEILIWLSVELAIVAIIASLAELFYWLKHTRKNRWVRRLTGNIPRAAVPFFEHLKKLAAVRCCLMFGVLAAFAYASYKACDECNVQFDKRIYGYFLSLDDGHSEARGPRSPYFIFKTPGTTPGEHLEPSAVRKMGDGSRVIVANHVDKAGQQMFWLFDVAGNKLVNPASLCTSAAAGDKNPFAAVGSVEAMYVGDPADDKVEVLGAPSFEKPEDRSLVRFSVGTKREANADATPGCKALAEPAREEIVDDPCAVFKPEGAIGCRIEGLTSATVGAELLFGVHDLLFPSARRADQPIRKPTVAIVKMSRSGNGWGNPDAGVQDRRLRRRLSPPEWNLRALDAPQRTVHPDQRRPS